MRIALALPALALALAAGLAHAQATQQPPADAPPPRPAIVDGKHVQPLPAPGERRDAPSVPGLDHDLRANGGIDGTPTPPHDLYGRPLDQPAATPPRP